MTQNQNDNVRIERLNEEHVARLAWLALDHRVEAGELSTHVFRQTTQNLTDISKMRAAVSELVQRNARPMSARVFAVLKNEKIVGCVSRSMAYGPRCDAFNLQAWIGVDYRRQGAGSAALKQIVARVSKKVPNAIFMFRAPADSRTGFGLMTKAGFSLLSEGPVNGNAREATFAFDPRPTEQSIYRIG